MIFISVVFESQSFSFLDHVWRFSFGKNDNHDYGLILTILSPIRFPSYLSSNDDQDTSKDTRHRYIDISCNFAVLSVTDSCEPFQKCRVFRYDKDLTSRGFYNFIPRHLLRRYVSNRSFSDRYDEKTSESSGGSPRKMLCLSMELEVILPT